MKAFDYYEGKDIKYPQKYDYIRYNVFQQDKVLGLGLTQVEAEPLAARCPKSTMSHYVLEEEFNEDKAKFNQQQKTLRQEFDKDILEEFGVTDNPKAQQALDLAKSRYSSYRQVYEEFEELVELVR